MTTIDLSALGADKMTPAELATLEEDLEANARYVRELRFARLERSKVADFADRRVPKDASLIDASAPRHRDDAFALAQTRSQTRDDPAFRLAQVVNECAHFSSDREVIARTAVDWATACGLEESVFIPIIIEAMNNLPRGGHRNVS